MKLDNKQLEKDWKSRILKNYLKSYFVNPLPKEQLEKLYNHFNSNPVSYLVVYKREILLQVVSAYILSFAGRVNWKSFSTYDLMDMYFVKYLEEEGSPFSICNKYEPLIITHGDDIIENKKLPEVVAQLMGTRESYKKKALFITLNEKICNFPYLEWASISDKNATKNKVNSTSGLDII